MAPHSIVGGYGSQDLVDPIRQGCEFEGLDHVALQLEFSAHEGALGGNLALGHVGKQNLGRCRYIKSAWRRSLQRFLHVPVGKCQL